jgi:hypothetical protein
MEIAKMAIKDNTIALMIKGFLRLKNKKVNTPGVKFRSSEVLGFGNHCLSITVPNIQRQK